jgi:hypothetical protein
MGRSFRELRAWRVGMELAVLVFDVTAELPAEDAGDSLRLAALEVPQRIAAGAMDGRVRPWVQGLALSVSALGELEAEANALLELRQIPREEGARMKDLIGQLRVELVALRKAAGEELEAARASELGVDGSVQVAA